MASRQLHRVASGRITHWEFSHTSLTSNHRQKARSRFSAQHSQQQTTLSQKSLTIRADLPPPPKNRKGGGRGEGKKRADLNIYIYQVTTDKSIIQKSYPHNFMCCKTICQVQVYFWVTVMIHNNSYFGAYIYSTGTQRGNLHQSSMTTSRNLRFTQETSLATPKASKL